MKDTTTPCLPPQAPEYAVAAAAEWRLLGLLFERPRPGWKAEIESVAGEVQDPALRAAAAATAATTESEYLDVLGPGGVVSPREVAYRGREDPGAILADVSSFYTAFAFHPRAEDPLDHVSVACGFAGYLRLKEAFAVATGDPESARTCAEAMARFIAEHLRYVAEPLCAKIELLSPVPHLLLAAHAFLQRTGPAPAPYADSVDADGDIPGCDGCRLP